MKESIDEIVKLLAKPASSVKHSEKIVRTISRSDIVKLNLEIDKKIRQNARESRESFEEAKDVVVKD